MFNALTDLFAGDSRAPRCLHEVGMNTCRVFFVVGQIVEESVAFSSPRCP